DRRALDGVHGVALDDDGVVDGDDAARPQPRLELVPAPDVHQRRSAGRDVPGPVRPTNGESLMKRTFFVITLIIITLLIARSSFAQPWTYDASWSLPQTPATQAVRAALDRGLVGQPGVD